VRLSRDCPPVVPCRGCDVGSYRVAPTDTYATISIRHYGHEGAAAKLRAANIGAVEPLIPGTTIQVPIDPSIHSREPITGPESDRLEVEIGGVPFTGWQSININLGLDSAASIGIIAPLVVGHITPLTYPPLRVTLGGVGFFAGTAVGINPTGSLTGPSLLSIAGYSTCGRLQNVTAPAGAYPLSFRRESLEQIAIRLCAPFGFGVVNRSADSEPFEGRQTFAPGTQILTFLSDLARKRGVLLSSTAAGDLLISDPPQMSAPVASLGEDSLPMIACNLEADGENYFSEITCVQRAGRRTPGGGHTVVNPRLDTMRPYARMFDDVAPGSAAEVARLTAGRMLADAVAVTVGVQGWRHAGGRVWAPGDTVRVHCPSQMIEKPYDFICRRVSLSQTESETAAELSLVLPGSFSGELPTVLPWDL